MNSFHSNMRHNISHVEIGKVKTRKKLLKNSESIRWIKGVGMTQQISEDIPTNEANLVQTVPYNGISDETLVQTKNLVNRSSTVGSIQSSLSGLLLALSQKEDHK